MGMDRYADSAGRARRGLGWGGLQYDLPWGAGGQVLLLDVRLVAVEPRLQSWTPWSLLQRHGGVWGYQEGDEEGSTCCAGCQLI